MTWRTSWTGPRTTLEFIDRILTEVIDPPVGATSLVRDPDIPRDDEKLDWTLHAYTEEPISNAALGLLPSEAPTPVSEELPERDWVADALEGLGIVRAGPFILYGRHDADDAALLDGIRLQIEANQAFGTGHHPTTAGCLEALGALTDVNPTRILDIGTGSGVLALAARKLFPEAAILASDIDRKSVDIAIENAETNGVRDIHFGCAAGTDHPLAAKMKPFDLVFANILAGPLRDLAPDLLAVTAPRSTIILAGLLDEQATDVLSVYAAIGFEQVASAGTSRWPVLILRRKNSIA